MWTRGEYEINQRIFPNKVVKGWVNGTFGLMEGKDGVEITHLQTGFRLYGAEVPYAGINVHKLICDRLSKRYNWVGDTGAEVAKKNGKGPVEMYKEIMDFINT